MAAKKMWILFWLQHNITVHANGSGFWVEEEKECDTPFDGISVQQSVVVLIMFASKDVVIFVGPQLDMGASYSYTV